MKKVSKKILISSSLVLLILVGVTLCIDYTLFKPTKINSFIANKIYKTPANIAFTDENFYKCVVDAYNEKNNTSVAYTTNLTDEQLKTITKLKCSGLNKANEEKIKDTEGLEKLTSLISLYLNDNQLMELDVSKNSELEYLDVYNNQLTNIDVSKNLELYFFRITNNQLTYIDVSKNAELTTLNVSGNQLTEINLSSNTKLQNLELSDNKLTVIDISKNNALKSLNVDFNQLTNLDVSNNVSLTYLNAFNNQLTTLYLNSLSLTELWVDNNQLTNLDLSRNTELKWLTVSNNQLTTLNIYNNTELTTLGVSKNKLTQLNISNNIALKSLSVNNNNLITLDVSNNVALNSLNVSDNQLILLDVSNNLSLDYLNVENNQLTKLDVSNNKKLETLYIYSNHFTENKGIYKDDIFDNTNSVVKLPEGKTSTITNNILKDKIEFVEKVDTSNQGYYQYDLRFEHNLANAKNIYTVKLNLYVIEATSNKYVINAEEGYIYTKTDTDEETILNNISLNYGVASIEDNKLLIKYDGELIKSFDIVNISSSKYDLSKKYIYTLTEELDLNNINVINGQKSIEDNKLLIKYDGELIKSFDIVKISNEKYDLTKGYIFDNEFNIDNITLTNGTKEVKDNQLLIKYDEDLLQSYDLISISSDKYDLTKDYIYIGTSPFTFDDFKVTKIKWALKDSKLEFKSHNGDLIKEYQVISINFGEYKTYDGLLILPEDITYEELTNNITTNGVTYKIFNGESEVTEGNISEGMIIKIYYEDEVIDEYEVTNEYLELDESLNIDNEVNIIEKLPRNLKLKDFISLINTSGSIEVRNNNALLSDDSVIGTGSKLKITLSNRVVEYTLSVRGDVTGNGQAKMADVMKIATHIIEGNVISGDAFERAADITGDGKIKMNDVMKLATFIIDGGEL